MAGLILPFAADNSQKIGGAQHQADYGLGAVLNDRACRRGAAGRRADRKLCFFMLFKKTPRPEDRSGRRLRPARNGGPLASH
jgi:hypothetical protein